MERLTASSGVAAVSFFGHRTAPTIADARRNTMLEWWLTKTMPPR